MLWNDGFLTITTKYKMTKITFTLILFLLTGFSFAENQTAADETSYFAEDTFEEAVYPQELNVPHALWRSVINVTTGWLEIPREIILENSKYPLLGIVSGTLRGAFFTTMRAVLSVVDIGLLGFTGPSGYDPEIFPEYVWNSQWNPYTSDSSMGILESKDDFVIQSASIGTTK